jgi:hypothetical protein
VVVVPDLQVIAVDRFFAHGAWHIYFDAFKDSNLFEKQFTPHHHFRLQIRHESLS